MDDLTSEEQSEVWQLSKLLDKYKDRLCVRCEDIVYEIPSHIYCVQESCIIIKTKRVESHGS